MHPHTNPPMQPRAIWSTVGLLTMINMLNYMDRISMSVLMPLMKKDLVLSDSQLGMLAGFAFFLVYATFGIPISRFADAGYRKLAIAGSLTVWSLMTAATGAVQNFWHLLVARAGLGIGEAGCIPASSSMISLIVPYESRARAFSVFSFGSLAGGALGIVVAGWLGAVVGWRWTFVILAAPGLVLAILVAWKLPKAQPAHVRGGHLSQESLKTSLATLFSIVTYRRIVIFLVINGFVIAGSQQWYASFYDRVHALSTSTIGLWLGIATGVGSAVGLIAGGIIADRTAKRDVAIPFRLGGFGLILSLPVLVGQLLVHSFFWSIGLLALAGALMSAPLGYLNSVLYSILPLHLRSTGGAVAVFLISMLGFSLGPLCVGVASDLLVESLGNESLRYALLLPLCFYPFYVPALFRIGKDVARELERHAST